MTVLVFAKKKKKQDGGDFTIYIGQLIKKETGEVTTVRVRFKSNVAQPDPAKCPCYIEFDKGAANLAVDHYVIDGESRTSRTLWISGMWRYSDKEFIDHSLDDYD